MTAPLLFLRDVTKTFGAVRALRGVSFELRAGEVHALLGENGAGKSTLIKIITGAHPPDDGVMEIEGQPVSHLTPAAAHKLGIACIYQQPGLFPDLSVAENIALRLEPATSLRRVRWSERRARAAGLLARIGARISPDTIARHLSMPEQQLVEIACALGAGARLVIMDEPTSSLTQEEQDRLLRIVGELRTQGAGVIYISHRLEEIFRIADRVTVLRDGRTVGTGAIRTRGAIVDSSSPGEPPSARALDEKDLIHLMIGREVSQIYPTSEGEPGAVVLAVRGVGCAASGIRDVSLELRAGEILGLAGLVGAGRTEFARILFGLTPADAGEIFLEGQRIRISSPHEAIAQGISYVPEDRRRHGIVLEMAVAENISMANHSRLFPGRWLRFDAEQQLAETSMRELGVKASGPDAPGHSLSGGNQQKVALARWLATKPRILILDEPTQGVDVAAKAEIHRIIRGLAREGMAVLMISSDLPEILGMSDRIAVMRGGTFTAIFPGKVSAHKVMAAALGQTEEVAAL